MAYYTVEDDYYQDTPEVPTEQQMEARLVEALGHHVHGSVNQALIKALKPFAQPLMRFGERELLERSPSENEIRDDQILDMGVYQRFPMGHASSAEILAHMAASVLKDHKYGHHSNLDFSGSFSLPASRARESSSSDTLESDKERADPKLAKHKKKTHHTEVSPLNNVCFDLENIIHPRSTEWVPCPEVAHYVQDSMRKVFDKDIRSTLCSGCPQPALIGKVADTPELDSSMATVLKKFAKDIKKGLDRAWKECQDKLLDIAGPLTKILELVVQAKESHAPLHPEMVLEWAQRAIYILDNINCPMSSERLSSCTLIQS
ncbi:hypothetical protein NDU88_001073 [Pleurodeles waltl]|uniref:Uncharacterized protein n=1 Tax=Pleurodeles waltl TaxID=8319 RepID=A0AAV7SYG5_PLEWA|nr:hypothetical protein NDU88_001073 [Pleurodeles waltl]